MPRIHLLIGPMGAGSSALALELAREHRGVRLTLDEWMQSLFGEGEEPEHWQIDECVERCLEQIWRLTQVLIDTGTEVILEISLLRRSERERFYARVDAAGYALTVYVQRHDGQPWEPPDDDECRGRDFRFV